MSQDSARGWPGRLGWIASVSIRHTRLLPSGARPVRQNNRRFEAMILERPALNTALESSSRLTVAGTFGAIAQWYTLVCCAYCFWS